MKSSILVIVFLLTGFNFIFSQGNKFNSEIIRDEKLFKEKASGYSLIPLIKDESNISSNINSCVSVKNDSLKFSISYIGGTSDNLIIKLVTDGVLYQDKDGAFYKVKLYFVENDSGQVSQIKNLSFDISMLNKSNIKFDGYQEIIKQKFN